MQTDLEKEIFHITVAVSHALQTLYLIVNPLRNRGGLF